MERCVLPEHVTSEHLVDLILLASLLANEPGGILIDSRRTTLT